MKSQENKIELTPEEPNQAPSEEPLAVVPGTDLNNYKTAQSNKLLETANDIQEMMVIAKNILQSCKEAEIDPMPDSQMNKIQYLTRQPLQYQDEVSVKESLKQVMLDTKPLPQTIPYIYSDIRDIFVDFYVKKKQMPTVIDLLKSLHDKRDHSFYKNAKIRTLVKNNLVKYHHLPKLNRIILSENPEFTYRRHLYLRQVIGCRTRGQNIIYVTVLKILSAVKPVSFIVIAASAEAGLIANSDSISCAGTCDDEFGNNQVKLWIRYELLPQLSSDAMIVLMQPHKEDITPTPFSAKVDMITWLQKQDIPFDADSHKAQLYRLVKIFKKKEAGFYEEVFTSGGLQVIVCPIEYQNLDFFDFNNICSKVNSNVSAFLRNLMAQLTRDEWKLIEVKIIEQEKQMMRDDEEMQRIVENLFLMAKNGDLKEEDFPDGCHGTKADNFAVHIGDIIVD